jgi:hypothetical protein
MSISINYSSTIGLHGIDPVITSKHLIEWITSYNDITVTGKTNFNNDIKLSYDSLNFLNINIDENANTIFNITNVGNNNNLSTFIYNNKIQANNGISINGDTIIGDSIDNSLFINSDIYINNNTIFNDVFFKDNIRIGGNLHITGTMNNPAISTNDITILGSNTNIGLTIDNTNTSNNSIINFKNNGNTIYSIGYSGSNQVFQICNSDFDSQPRITINSSGNVGIGTANIDGQLNIKNENPSIILAGAGGTANFTSSASSNHNEDISNNNLHDDEVYHSNTWATNATNSTSFSTLGYAWIAYEFEEPVIINKYYMWARGGNLNQAPKIWQFRASVDSSTYNLNDPSSYTVLNIQTLDGTEANDWTINNYSITEKASDNINNANSYSFSNNNKFKYYVLHITENYGSASVGLLEWALEGNFDYSIETTGGLNLKTLGKNRLTITDNGFVGIGTDNPVNGLDIHQIVPVLNIQSTTTSGEGDARIIVNSNDVGDSSIILNNIDTAGTNHNNWRIYTNSNDGILRFNHTTNQDGTPFNNNDNQLKIDADANVDINGDYPHLKLNSGSDKLSTVSFGEAQTSRGQIQFDGSPAILHIGTISGSTFFKTINIKRGDNKVGINKGNSSLNAALDVVGNILASGTVSGGSDDRIKFNEQKIDNSLNLIKKLNIVKYDKLYEDINLNLTDEEFNLKKDNLKYCKEIGIIAQELQDIDDLKFVVSGGETQIITNDDGTETEQDNIYSVAYNNLFNLHIKATQELIKKIENLETELRTLKETIDIT